MKPCPSCGTYGEVAEVTHDPWPVPVFSICHTCNGKGHVPDHPKSQIERDTDAVQAAIEAIIAFEAKNGPKKN